MSESTTSSSSGGGIGFVGLLTIVFITLKLLGKIEWAWWWVVSPVWIAILAVIAVLIVALGVAGVVAGVSALSERRKRAERLEVARERLLAMSEKRKHSTLSGS